MESLTAQWSLKKKVLFLFLFLYTFFYIFPFPFDAFPQLEFIFRLYGRAQAAFVHWTGKTIFGFADPRKPPFSDSGDTSFDFASVFSFLLLSAALAIMIGILDRKRGNYEKLGAWGFLYLRYCIGFYMILYGFDKVFKSHFPFPSLEKLEQPFGQSTPQGLLWAFMGYSTPYTVYLGAIEVLSGFLLLFRRTTAIGSFIVLAIMINITIINFSYDVPVKLFALHLVFFAIVLSWPFLRPVFDFFFLRKMTTLRDVPQPALPAPLAKYKNLIKTVVIVAYTGLFISFSMENMRKDGDASPVPELYGIYRYENSNVKEAARIEEIIFDKKVTILKWKEQRKYYRTTADPSGGTILFISNSDSTDRKSVHYDFDIDLLTLYENDSTSVQFRRVDPNSFPLINRGFHWIVEHPFNN